MGEYGLMDIGTPGLVIGVGSHRKQIESWAAGEQIEHGKPMFAYSGQENIIWKPKRDVSIVNLDADLITGNTLSITVNDVVVDTPFNTNHDTTISDAISNLQAAITGLVAIAIDAVNNRQILISLITVNLIVTGVVTGGASQAGVIITYSTYGIFIGISCFEQSSKVNSRGVYEIGDAVNVLTHGKIYIDCSTSALKLGFVYVIWKDLDNQGKFTNSPTDTYDINSRFRGNLASPGLVSIEVNGTYKNLTP